MIGDADTIDGMWRKIKTQENLIVYSGPALESGDFRFMDVHYCHASKGAAVAGLKEQLGVSNIICFGDSDNDLSMVKLADESYAPENAKAEIKACASAVIGHYHENGIAHFLRERFEV
jgi:hydroxymethylpyrimidine pyrophosphatase-like HAD family hydrolase